MLGSNRKRCRHLPAQVRRIARQLVSAFNDDSLLCVLDDGSEHRHRMALTADVKVLDGVLARLQEGCARERLEVSRRDFRATLVHQHCAVGNGELVGSK